MFTFLYFKAGNNNNGDGMPNRHREILQRKSSSSVVYSLVHLQIKNICEFLTIEPDLICPFLLVNKKESESDRRYYLGCVCFTISTMNIGTRLNGDTVSALACLIVHRMAF